jgi:hypothetical protein
MFLLPAFLSACGRPALSDSDFLERCWQARPSGGGGHEYEIRFDALVIPGVEGGTYARSSICPDARLRLSFSQADVPTIDAIGRKAIESSALGAGIRGSASVSVGKRVNPFYMTVGVERIESLREMSKAETEQFIRKYKIG